MEYSKATKKKKKMRTEKKTMYKTVLIVYYCLYKKEELEMCAGVHMFACTYADLCEH